MMTSGSREALKWLALVFMTGDHVNTGLADYGIPWLYEFGRIAMPIFAAVFAYGIASAEAEASKLRTTRNRLLVFGAIAHVPYMLAFGLGWDTFNILFAFAVAVQCVIWSQQPPGIGVMKAALLLALAGFYLEFLWLAPLVTLAWVWYWRSHEPGRVDAPLAAVWGATALLCALNGNLWAFASLPLVHLLRGLEFRIPRSPWAFWVYYPAHFAVIALVAKVLHPE